MDFPSLDKLDVSSISDLTTDFRAGVDDGLKTVSAYSTKATDSLTAFRSSITDSINNTLKSLTGNLLSVKDLGDFIKVENGSITFNQQELVSRIQKATGVNVSSKDSALSGVEDKLFNTVNQATNGMLGKIIDKNGNVVLLDTMSTDNELGKLTSMIDKYLDSQGNERTSFNYYDRVSTSAMADSLIRQAAQAGNYEDVRSLYDTADDTLKPTLASSLGSMLPIVGNNGDFRTAAVITDIIGVVRARALVPGLPVLLFRSYRVPRYLALTEYDAEATRLMTFIDAYSPGVRIGSYHGKTVEILTLWMQTSSGILKLFSRSKEYAPFAYLGRKFIQSSTQTLLKARYPDLATVKLVSSTNV